MTERAARRAGAAVAGVAAIGLALAAVPAATAQEPGTAPTSCADAASAVEIGAGVPLLDWSENVGFDGDGNLWVSRVLRGEVQRHDETGAVTASVAVDSPGAIRLGPDGLLYVTFGDTVTNMLPGVDGGGVVRFDPSATDPVVEEFVTGLGMANGADFDEDGNLYVADTGSGVVRIGTDGVVDTEWSAQTQRFMVNGVAVRDGSVYVTVMHTGEILRIPIDDPANPAVVARTTLGTTPISAVPDDLAFGADGALYVATSIGRLVRVDPDSGAGCTVAAGEPLTSVVTIPGTPDLAVGTLAGNILRVTPAS